MPTKTDLRKALGNTYGYWETFVGFAKEEFPDATEE